MALRGTIKVVYEKVSATLQERGYELSWKRCYGTAVSFLKTATSFFSSFLHHIFSLFSRQFVFVMQTKDAKQKNHY